MKHKLILQYLAAFIAGLIAIPAMAQYPADNHVGQVDARVGGELYGNNSSGLTLRPYQVKLLPSEERNAIVRSGMLPSEFELNRIGYGPLSPNGILDYVTPRSPLQRAMNLPSPQLYNPSYDLTLQPYAKKNDDQGPAKAGFEGTTTLNKEKHPESQASPLPTLSIAPAQPLPTGELSTGQLPSGQLHSLPESLPPVHTVSHLPTRHGTLLLKHPATQPTTPPQPKQ